MQKGGAEVERVNLHLVKKLRVQKKLSQAEMADALGLSNMWAYHRKERGDQAFTAGELRLLSIFHKKKMEDFFEEVVAKNATKEEKREIV